MPDDGAAQAAYLKHRAHDPYPDIPPALLNSADILDYVAATGMIYPFDPVGLKSASYEVPLLGDYLFIDKEGNRQTGTLEKGGEIKVPKNSIMFLTVEPYFRIPDYIALRHNLKIDHIYKGLLVGTGPLIDPGFVGRIALPLHNLTENDYVFKGGEGIIWVEFTKLSPIPGSTSAPQEPRRAQYILYQAEKTKTRTVNDYVRTAIGSGKEPASSSAKLERDVDDFRKLTRRLSTWGALAIVGLFFAVFGGVVPVMISGLRDQVNSEKSEIDDQNAEVQRLRDQIDQLTAKINQPAVSSSPNPPGKP